jgi:nucleotide-binding universal stress UspA family protein
MFQRILIPLDGSSMAECALPVAAAFAERCGASLVLFHVVEKGASASVHGERHLQTQDEAQAYLDELSKQYSQRGLAIDNHVHEETEIDVPDNIIQHAVELEIDLVVMSAHGRSGLRDRFIGSIAQQVIQRGMIPVLFVRPEMDFTQVKFPPERILVPLDGEGQHEQSLPAAQTLAESCGAVISLATVVPTPGTLSSERAGTGMLLPISTAAVLDLAERGAVDYLRDVVKKLIKQGIKANGQVLRGDTATMVLEVAEKADLIIMATHGRTNWDAFWEESVTPKVMARTKIPILLVRAP